MIFRNYTENCPSPKHRNLRWFNYSQFTRKSIQWTLRALVPNLFPLAMVRNKKWVVEKKIEQAVSKRATKGWPAEANRRQRMKRQRMDLILVKQTEIMVSWLSTAVGNRRSMAAGAGVAKSGASAVTSAYGLYQPSRLAWGSIVSLTFQWTQWSAIASITGDLAASHAGRSERPLFSAFWQNPQVDFI